MNFAAIAPRPNIPMMSRPMKVTPRGNMFKIIVNHPIGEGQPQKNHEIWMTKEAIQKHFGGQKTELENYQIKQFAKRSYEKAMRSANGNLEHNGLLVTTDGITRGNTAMWPHTISHPEVKL